MSFMNITEGQFDLMSENARVVFSELRSGLSSERLTLIDKIKIEVVSQIPRYLKIADFKRPVEQAEDIFLRKTTHFPDADRALLRRALVASLALQLPDIVERSKLPHSILVLYPDAFGRLAKFLGDGASEPYDSTGEFFCKDIRFVTGLSIPCGARIVDLNSRVTLHSVILSALRSGRIDGLIRYVRAQGGGPWFRNHADSRYLDEYNEKAHDRFYVRVAELLKQHEHIRGLAGGSWYYDPQLLRISPHLAYLQERQRERGAFFLKHGTRPSDIEAATKTSRTRRRLYEEGQYNPVNYSMLWPRKQLIAWSEKSRSSIDERS
jgi:hypothetical protein